MKCKLFVDL